MSNSDGYISQNIRVIKQHSSGLLFFGTRSGLSVYDGYKFENYNRVDSLKIGRINDVFELPQGGVYIATDHQNIFLYKNGGIKPVFASNTLTLTNFEQAPWGELLSAAREGICRITPGGPQLIPSLLKGKRFFDLETLSANIMAACGDNAPLILFNSKHTIVDSLPARTIYDIAPGYNNDLWLATSDGLVLMDKSKAAQGRIKMLPLPNVLAKAGLATDVVTTVKTDHYNNLWIGTVYNGLYKYHDGKLSVYNQLNGFAYDRVLCMLEDGEYNIWIGTDAGAFKVPNPLFDFFNRKNGLVSNITSGAVWYRGKLSIATNSGISELNEHSIKKFTTTSTTVDCMNIDTSAAGIIFTNTNELHLLPLRGAEMAIYALPAEGYFYPRNMPVNYGDYKFFPTSNGIVYGGVAAGWQLLKGVNDDVRACSISKIGRLLFAATATGQLKTFKLQRFAHTLTATLQKTVVLPSVSQSLVFDRQGNLWVGTLRNGILVYSIGSNGQLLTKTALSYKNGLSSNTVYSLFADAKGSIWVGSDAGVDRFTYQKKRFLASNFYKVYDFQQEIYNIYQSPDGNIWLCGFDGLVKIYGSRKLRRPNAPEIMLTDVQVSGVNDTVYAYPSHSKKLILPYYDNTLTFNYTSPGFRKEHSHIYVYRLLGSNDTAWSQPSARTSVIFGQIKPGKYRFEVKARDVDGQWSVTAAGFNFNVVPPFWLTPWFYLLVTLLLVAFIYMLYRYRINQLQKVMLVRNRISRDLHDDIGATLSSIKILTEVARKKILSGNNAESVGLIDKVNHQSVQMIDQMGDIIWSVNPANDNIDRLMERIQNQFSPLCAAKGVALHLSVSNTAVLQKLRMEYRKHLYLVVKEALHNALKYAGASAIEVQVTAGQGKLHLNIADDGGGFNTDAIPAGNGLRNMRERVRLMNGDIQIITALHNGTTIYISCPLT